MRLRAHHERREGQARLEYESNEVARTWYFDHEDHCSGDLVATIAVTGRADLTDAQWAVLEPLLPKWL